MTIRSKSRALCVAASLALITVAPAPAYAYQSVPVPSTGGSAPGGDARDPFTDNRPEGERAATGRLARRERQRRAEAPAAPTPEQVMAEAQTFLTANSISCQITEAALKGQTAEGHKLYEVACANDLGYLALTSTPPMILNCLEISETQRRTLAADPAAQVGPKCELPVNDNFMPVLTSYAQAAGVACSVDQATIIGKRGNNDVYEIGCAGSDGYQIAKENGAWSKTSCLELASANVTCNYTTKEEQIADVTKWFAGSDAAACNISNVRYMGGNANGAFYEAACNGSDGLIARLNAEKQVQQVYPCAEAAQIGGGCKLTAGAPQGTNG